MKLDLAKVKIPIYELFTKEDHIAPANSVFIGSKLFGGPVRHVMAGSGHIAGVVNPPAKKKYQFWSGEPAATLSRMDGESDRDAWLLVAGLGRMARRAVRSQGPGARSVGRAAEADRGRAGVLRERAPLGANRQACSSTG